MLFIPNRSFAEEMAKEPEFRALVSSASQPLAKAVSDAMPVGSTGHARSSVEVIASGRASVTVSITDFAGHLIEWGSVNNSAYAPLRRGARAAGFRLTEK